jgi:hypothetical protein
MQCKDKNKPRATTHHTGDKRQILIHRATASSQLRKLHTSAAKDTPNPSTQDTDITVITVVKSTTGTLIVIRTGKMFVLAESKRHPQTTTRRGLALFHPPGTLNTSNRKTLSQPAAQSNNCIRKIGLPDANNGTVLLDSGSTVNVSGRLHFSRSSQGFPIC